MKSANRWPPERLKVGDKLPAQNALAKELGVSMTPFLVLFFLVMSESMNWAR